MLLRAESGEADPELAKWWTEFQELKEDDRNSLTKAKRPRRRRRRRPPASGESGKE